LNKRNLSKKWLIHLSRYADILQLRVEVGWNLVLSQNDSTVQRWQYKNQTHSGNISKII